MSLRAKIYIYAARAMLRIGAELPKAESYLQKYISQTKEPEVNAPRLEGAHWSLGLVYEKEGRKADAIQELETALRIKPTFEPAKRDLKRLK
jgi:tetratricopeptide (TPR) repeat protein